MTISADYTPNRDTGNGATRTFAVNFPFGAPGDLVVTLFDTTAQADVLPAPVLNGGATYDYSVSGTPDPDTGIYPNGGVTFNNAPLARHRVVRARATPELQEMALTNNARFPAKTVEGAFDRQEMQLQERSDVVSRALTAPVSDVPLDMTIPALAARAGYPLGFDLSGRPALVGSTSAEIQEAVLAILASSAIAAAGSVGVFVATTAALMSLFGAGVTVPNNLTVLTNGRGAVGDGGGALFYYKEADTTSADNGGTIRVDGRGRRWYVVAKGEISAALFGAAGDNSADDTAAIQAALDSGLNVYLQAGALCKTTAALLSSTDRQVLRTAPGAAIYPHFDGDVYRSTGAMAECHVLIDGANQPGIGTAGAAIVIGYNGAVAWKNSIAGSRVNNFYGDGLRWENGAGLDLTRSWMNSCTGDGYKCTANYDDNNHGIFIGTEATSCGGNGYAILAASRPVTPPDQTYEAAADSRAHVFQMAKGWGNNRNFLIQTCRNVGTIFTENGVTHDLFDTYSNGNWIIASGSTSGLEDIDDIGLNNQIGGYTIWQQMVFRDFIANMFTVNNQAEGRWQFYQTGPDQFADATNASANPVIVTHGPGDAPKRTDIFDGTVQFHAGAPNKPATISQASYGQQNVATNGLADGSVMNFDISAADYGIGDGQNVLLTLKCAGVASFTGPLELHWHWGGGSMNCTIVNHTGAALTADSVVTILILTP